MTENAPPEREEGSVRCNPDEALDITPRQTHRQTGLATKEVSASTNTVKTEDAAGRVIIARGRLAEARRWFAHCGWDVLPQGIRGQRILAWGADHAYLASPANPERGVRRWCRCWARLTDDELAGIVAYTRTSNKRWSADQCAVTLEISVRDRQTLGLRFIGANDDADYEIRLALKRAKAAIRARRFRAAHSTGAKRGRPALELSPEQKRARTNAQAAERMRRLRALRKTPSRDISNIGSVMGFSVTPVTIPASMLQGTDFGRFGIIAIRVMRGIDVVLAWNRTENGAAP